MDKDTLAKWNDAITRREAAVLVTHLDSGDQRLVTYSQVWQTDPLADQIGKLFKSGRSGIHETEAGDKYFLNVILPPVRLVVIGAVHITQTLVPMAQSVGFDVKVIDPRTAFATKERFPNVNLIVDWPQEVPDELDLDPFTALVTVTHDPKIDDFPILKALAANCFYIGALGSKKTHAKRIDRLQESGLNLTDLDRIHAPIGLDIGASSPAEIAVAILAEILKTLRKSS